MENIRLQNQKELKPSEETTNIEKEIEQIELSFLDKVGDMPATPFGEKSQYKERDWKILRTHSSLEEHPQWKKLIEIKKEWTSLEYAQYWNTVEFGERIDIRNRVLDQIRFEAVQKQNLNEQIIEEWFAKFNYNNSVLKEKLLSAYKKNHKYPRPENPSDSYIRAEAQTELEHIAVDIWWAVRDIKKALQEIQSIEKQNHGIAHTIDVDTQDILRINQEKADSVELSIKEEYMDISADKQAKWRQVYANRLKEFHQDVDKKEEQIMSDSSAVYEHNQKQAEETKQRLLSLIEQKKEEITKLKSRETVLKQQEKSSGEDIEQFKNEQQEEIRRQINETVLSFKVDFDEFTVSQKIKELEGIMNNISKTTPYLDNGEPDKPTLDSFKSEHNIS